MKKLKINADEVVAFKKNPDSVYGSRMLTGDEMAGFPVVNINDGVLAPYSRTGGAAHEDVEIYYMLDVGEDCAVVLDDEPIPVRNHDIIVIPAGVNHWIDNTRCDKPFRLLTIWDRQELNETYHHRFEAWGEAMRYVKDQK